MSRQASMELHSDPDISSSIKAKAQKMSKVNPKKRWLNGIDHLLNIVQNPEKTKTRLPGSHSKYQIFDPNLCRKNHHKNSCKLISIEPLAKFWQPDNDKFNNCWKPLVTHTNALDQFAD